MLKRTITAVALVSILGLAFYLGSEALSYLIYGLLAIAAYEVYRIKRDKWPLFMIVLIVILVMASIFIDTLQFIPYLSLIIFTLLTFSILFPWFEFEDVTYLFMMITILSLTIISIRNIMTLGLSVFGYIIIANFATDTFAYLGGSLFGKHKLIERISPNKTVEGAVIGTLGSIGLSLLFAHFFVNLEFNIIFMASLFIPLVAQIGDLSFSMIKRHFNIKDFGNIFPGHGGVLDRVDSVMFSIIVFNLVLSLY